MTTAVREQLYCRHCGGNILNLGYGRQCLLCSRPFERRLNERNNRMGHLRVWGFIADTPCGVNYTGREGKAQG